VRLPRRSRDAAICAATLAVLAEDGYDRMTIDAVAARAHASKATIYRRWKGKRELVLEALRTRTGCPGDAVDTGDLRGDLLATLRAMADSAGDADARLMAGVLRAMRSAPELGDCLREQVFHSKAAALRTVVDRAVLRGEVPPDADAALAHEVAGAMWVHHVLVVGGSVDDAFIEHVTDDVLIPLLGRSSRPTHLQETS
jgi:AcrR family transcriptional regulator